MKQLNEWIKKHPYKAIAFVFMFVLIAACIAVVNERVLWCGIVVYSALAILWIMIFSRDIKKLLPIILASAIAAQSIQAEEPPNVSPGVVVGVVVVCVGGYCVYRVVKFCQRKFPKETPPSTNSPPAFVPTTGDNETAASWNYGAMGSCDPTLPPGLLASETSGTLFAVDVLINQSGEVSLRTSANGDTQNWTDFQSEVAKHGVYITGNPDGSQYFATNRVPCSPHDVPILFDDVTKTISVGHDGLLLEVERSRDLQNWVPYLRVVVGTDQRGLRIEDATTAVSMFYRVKVSNQ